MKVHLVDGTFELFRCFHGAPRATNREGKEVGAVRGLLHTLLSLLKADDVTHLAVAFDQLPSPRGNLGDDPGTLVRSQAGLAMEAVRGLGIRLWPMYRFQADDALATGAFKLKNDPQVLQIVICTTDTDLYQCISGERVVVLDRIRKITIDEGGVRSKLGIRPHQFPDYLALVGASAKGLPGVPGWGRKVTAAVLERYGTLEQIPHDPGEWDVSVRGVPRLASALAARREEALLIKGLATLRADLPIDCAPSKLRWERVDRQRLHQVIETTDAHDLYERLERWDKY